MECIAIYILAVVKKTPLKIVFNLLDKTACYCSSIHWCLWLMNFHMENVTEFMPKPKQQIYSVVRGKTVCIGLH